MISKLDLRMEAARLAVGLKDVNSENVISVCKDLEVYLLGNAEIPEVYDPNFATSQLMQLMNENLKAFSGSNTFGNSFSETKKDVASDTEKKRV